MLDDILKLVQGPVIDAITKSEEVPAEKKEVAIDSTTNAIADTLQKSITPDNISHLVNLFGGSNNTSSSNNSLVSGIESTIVNVLSKKIGISSTAASSVAAAIIPSLIKVLTSKVSGGKNGGMDIGALMGMFGGNNNSASGKENIAEDVLGAMGKFFNK